VLWEGWHREMSPLRPAHEGARRFFINYVKRNNGKCACAERSRQRIIESCFVAGVIVPNEPLVSSLGPAVK